MKIIDAKLAATAVDPAGYPEGSLPEVAFAGRSNVGKSSMINALCQRHKLVRVSNTPGRTRTLNFFDVVAEQPDGVRRAVRFCDLPGYGFAKVSKGERQQWQKMIGDYLTTREPLRAVIAIVDARVGPTPDDEHVVLWLAAHNRPVVVVATKLDKLPKHRRTPREREVERALGLPRDTVVGVSATERLRLDALWERIAAACWR